MNTQVHQLFFSCWPLCVSTTLRYLIMLNQLHMRLKLHIYIFVETFEVALWLCGWWSFVRHLHINNRYNNFYCTYIVLTVDVSCVIILSLCSKTTPTVLPVFFIIHSPPHNAVVFVYLMLVCRDFFDQTRSRKMFR